MLVCPPSPLPSATRTGLAATRGSATPPVGAPSTAPPPTSGTASPTTRRPLVPRALSPQTRVATPCSLGVMEPYLIDWLSNKTEDEQDNIVKFCIKQGRKSKALCQSHEEYVAKLQDERLIETNQKKR